MMKIKLLALGVACACAAPAWAQSSVTVFGIMDLAVRRVSNENLPGNWSEISGGNSTSRVGFRGIEDLGNGLSAGFHLEHGLNAANGSPASSAQFWDRRSTVSLMSKTLGEVRLGRDFTPSYMNWSRYDPFAHVGVASAGNFISASPLGPLRSAFANTTNPNTTARSNNAVQYLLPGGIGGVEGGLMVADGDNGAVANGLARLIGVRLGYAAGPFGVSAASTTSKNALTGTEKLKDTAIGGNYDAGVVRISAVWRQFKLFSAKQTNTLIAGVVPLGSGEVKLSWQKANFDGTVGATNIAANAATQLGLGYVHNLSRRTALYGTVSRIDNKGTATLAVPGGTAGLAGGGASTGAEAGLRHNF